MKSIVKNKKNIQEQRNHWCLLEFISSKCDHEVCGLQSAVCSEVCSLQSAVCKCQTPVLRFPESSLVHGYVPSPHGPKETEGSGDENVLLRQRGISVSDSFDQRSHLESAYPALIQVVL